MVNDIAPTTDVGGSMESVEYSTIMQTCNCYSRNIVVFSSLLTNAKEGDTVSLITSVVFEIVNKVSINSAVEEVWTNFVDLLKPTDGGYL